MRLTIASFAEINGDDQDDIRHAAIIHLLRQDEIIRTWKVYVPRRIASRRTRWSFFYSIPKVKGVKR